MAGAKITCATCAAEFKSKCNAKKGRPSVALNKRRRCDKYVLEPSKVRAKQILKTIRVPYKEKEALRREYKEQLRLHRASAQNAGSVKHPLTGDLSRFQSTAAGGDRG
jgi:hypothetical protein